MSATRADDLPIDPESELRREWSTTVMECVGCGWIRCYPHAVAVEPETVQCFCGSVLWDLFDGKRRDWRVLH